MKLTLRSYESENDYWLVRAFLRALLPINGYRQRSWDVARWDYWRWHGVENIEHYNLREAVWLWEAPDGRIAALLNVEGGADAFAHVDPRLRSLALEREMIATAETRLPLPRQDGRRVLRLWANRDDDLRRALLCEQGFAQQDGPEYQRRRAMRLPIPDAPLPPGFCARSLGGVDELPARSYLSWQAFHPDEPDEHYEGWDWYLNIQRAPLYRRDLDLVAVSPEGELAAFCTIWYDDATRVAIFEPVGTAPRFQRLGLGKAVMAEGLRRLQCLGAAYAFVGSYSPGASALYASMGFSDYQLSDPWEKRLS